MSHKLFHHANFSNARVWDFLEQVDAAEAQEACRAAGCPRCGGVLHHRNRGDRCGTPFAHSGQRSLNCDTTTLIRQ